LNHRVKNSLATVQSLAQQTLRKSASPAEFKDAFTGRLLALSKTHNALSKTDWVDADFINLCGAVCPNSNDQIVMDGPLVLLRPRAALTIGMVLHELCTNAAKHGALADPAGRIDLSWKVDDKGVFHFVWIETTAQPITPPGSMSFGMRYIKNSIQHELGGAVSFDFPSEGLVVRGSFPNGKEPLEASDLKVDDASR
jgi:two-component sensor histidine kinase